MTAKTWGPFTGAQLFATIGLPGALVAQSALQNVAVTDPVSGRRAAVDTALRLRVGDGAGPMTVDGSVLAKETAPANIIRRWDGIMSSDGCVSLATPPTGKAFVVKTIIVNTFNNPTPGPANFVGIYIDTPAHCGAFALNHNPGGIGTVALPIEPGLTVPAGQSLNVAVAGGPQVEVFVYGYAVPAAQVPATAVEPAQQGIRSPQQASR